MTWRRMKRRRTGPLCRHPCGGRETSDCEIFATEIFVFEDLLGRTGKGDLTGVEDHRPVGEAKRGDRVLLDDDGGDSECLDLVEDPFDLLDDDGGEALV